MNETYHKLKDLEQRIVKLASENERLELTLALTDDTVEKLSRLCDLYKNLAELYKRKNFKLKADKEC